MAAFRLDSNWSPVISFYTAYKTFVARFLGKVCFSNRLVLTHLDGVPAYSLACFFRNLGAKLGSLDDFTSGSKHNDTGQLIITSTLQMMRQMIIII